MANKRKTVYCCAECGNETSNWAGRCPACGAWNTLQEVTIEPGSGKKSAVSARAAAGKAKPLSELDTSEEIRFATGISEFDRVLGGGAVAGSLVLVGGAPGIGKSTLLLQMCASAGAGRKILYVTGEESQRQLKLRAMRLGVDGENIYVLAETDIDSIIAAIDELKPDIAIIDSVQTVSDSGVASAPGSITQVRECTMRIMRVTKEKGLTVFVVFEIKNLGDGFLNDISINVRRHEIVGLYGLMGSGCSEVLQCAFGARRHLKGSFFVNGKEIKINNPIDAKNAGLAYVPAERKREGLILAHSVLNNLTIVTLKDFVKGLFLDLKEERRTAQKWCENYRIKTPSLNTPASSLSGGNQQKIVISKWVATKPKVFMLNDPTKGIDVGAKVEIYKDIERLCKAGCGVLYVAAELPELLGIADRVYVIHEGKLAGEFSGEEITQKNIVKSAIGE